MRLRFLSVICLGLMPTTSVLADDAHDTTIEVRGNQKAADVDPDRPVAKTSKKQLEERQPQSTPDALKYSPGVYVQQTAHGQGSPYIRGRTGQQTLLLFDGLRLNHALFRKGPNQYLFTVDAHTIRSLEVIRGSAGVELGNDAIAGAILIRPLEPALDPTRKGWVLRPSAFVQYGSADGEIGGRLQVDAQLDGKWGVLAGVGGRTVGQLEAGGNAFPDGRAEGQACESILSVPCFESDGRTQKGTGFDEFTADVRAVYADSATRWTTAAYIYRQFDAPRTDQCPAPEAAIGECLEYDEQFRTHVYGRYESTLGYTALDSAQGSVSYQRQHQRYHLTRPDRTPNDGIDTTNVNGGRDVIDGVSAFVKGITTPLSLGTGLALTIRYGADGSFEWVGSEKWITFAEPLTTRFLSRGQYIDGSTYAQGGMFLAPALQWHNLRIRTGFRAGLVQATSPGDVDSASRAFTQTHVPIVANAGLRWGDSIALILNVEQGFRAPNLDDLVARQSTGQGYQLDNPDLGPEKALTLEAGVKLKNTWISGEILAFRQILSQAIERRLLTPSDCQLNPDFVDQACRANRAPMQLINLTGDAEIYGAEARIDVIAGRSVDIRTTVSYAVGEGDSPNPDVSRRVPLSRIPPLNGTSEITWRHAKTGLYLGAAMRWAMKQDRLSIGDLADARIPKGGTPGYIVSDLRTGLRLRNKFRANLIIQNLADARYRTHGSGVYGAGRSIITAMELML